jgi:hypothetical protein
MLQPANSRTVQFQDMTVLELDMHADHAVVHDGESI